MKNTQTKQGKWMWYPSDYEIWLGEKLLLRRDHRGVMVTPHWRMDGHYKSIKFSRTIELELEENITVEATGECAVRIDAYDWLTSENGSYILPKGRHTLLLDVYGIEKIPAVKITGKTVFSDENWMVHNGDLKLLKVACDEKKPDGLGRRCVPELFDE
jgi:hypothetical protein